MPNACLKALPRHQMVTVVFFFFVHCHPLVSIPRRSWSAGENLTDDVQTSVKGETSANAEEDQEPVNL